MASAAPWLVNQPAISSLRLAASSERYKDTRGVENGAEQSLHETRQKVPTKATTMITRSNQFIAFFLPCKTIQFTGHWLAGPALCKETPFA